MDSSTPASVVPTASVFLASVAGPLLPTPIHSFHPITPSKLRTSITSEEVTYDTWEPKDEDEDWKNLSILQDPRSERGSLALVLESLFKLITTTRKETLSETPTYLLAYGPFTPTLSTSGHPKAFQYQLYLHYTHIPDDDYLRIAYGNSPIYPIHLLRLNSEISEDYIASLPTDCIRLITIAANLLLAGHTRLNELIPLEHDNYFLFAYPPPDATQPVYRYPTIEVVLSLATYFVYQPHGEYARQFRRWHLDAARTLFTSPSASLINEGSDSSIDHSKYSAASSCEWEEVSSKSVTPDADNLRQSGTSTSIPEATSQIGDLFQSTSTTYKAHDDTSPSSEGFPQLSMSIDDDYDELNIYASEEEDKSLPAAPGPSTVELPNQWGMVLWSPNTPRSQSSSPTPLLLPQATPNLCNGIVTISKPNDGLSSEDRAHEESLSLPSDSLPTNDESFTTWSTEPTIDIKCLVETETSVVEEPAHELAVVPTLTPLTFGDHHTVADDNDSKHLYWNILGEAINENKVNEGTETYTGPAGDAPGIFAYGPAYISYSNTSSYDYYIYVHASFERHRDVLDYFAYGGSQYLDGAHVDIHRLPISPLILNSSLDGLQEFSHVVHQIEAYLRGDPRLEEGVLIPPELMFNPIRIPTATNNTYYRFPIVEKLLGTLAARLSHPRLAHPFGQLRLNDIHRFVSPKISCASEPTALCQIPTST